MVKKPRQPVINRECLPLSNYDIQDILQRNGVKVKFLLYKNIKRIKDIRRYMPCFILIQHHNNLGHWVSLFQNEDGINYFDSLGYFPDRLLEDDVFDNNRKKVNADRTYLIEKLYNTGQGITYNDYPLQNENSLCCGHWTIFRLLNQPIKNNDFLKLFKRDRYRDFTIVDIVNRL